MAEQLASGAPDLEHFREYLRTLARLNLNGEDRAKLDASDLVQETLLKAYRSREEFRGSSERELVSWLRKILARTMADAVRANRRDKRDVGLERSLAAAIDESSARLENWLAADQSSPSQQAVRNERLTQLATALAELPEEQRTAIELHHLKGCSLTEVARQLDRTTASVAGLIRRGLLALKGSLDRYGGT